MTLPLLRLLEWTSAHNGALITLLAALALALTLWRARRAGEPPRVRPPGVVPGVTEWRLDRDGYITESGGDLEAVGFRPGQAARHHIREYVEPGSEAERRYRLALDAREAQDWVDVSTLADGSPYVGRTVLLPTEDGGLWCRSTALTPLVRPLLLRAEEAEARAETAEARVADLIRFASEDAVKLFDAQTPAAGTPRD